MFYFGNNVSVNQQSIFKLMSGHVEVNSALMLQDLKHAETNLVVVYLFKYSMLSIPYQFTFMYDRGKPNHILSPTKNTSALVKNMINIEESLNILLVSYE